MPLLSRYQQKTIKNYQNFLAKDLKDQCIGIKIKQKVRIKTPQTSIDIFLNQTLVRVNRLFVWIYPNQIDSANSTGASDRNFYTIFNKRFRNHLETLLTIHRPKKLCQLGHSAGL